MDETIEFSSEFMYDLVCAQTSEPGDLNQDNTINVLDIMLILDIIFTNEGKIKSSQH